MQFDHLVTSSYHRHHPEAAFPHHQQVTLFLSPHFQCGYMEGFCNQEAKGGGSIGAAPRAVRVVVCREHVHREQHKSNPCVHNQLHSLPPPELDRAIHQHPSRPKQLPRSSTRGAALWHSSLVPQVGRRSLRDHGSRVEQHVSPFRVEHPTHSIRSVEQFLPSGRLCGSISPIDEDRRPLPRHRLHQPPHARL